MKIRELFYENEVIKWFGYKNETDIINNEGREILDDLKTNILKQWFKEQLLNEEEN